MKQYCAEHKNIELTTRYNQTYKKYQHMCSTCKTQPKDVISKNDDEETIVIDKLNEPKTNLESKSPKSLDNNLKVVKCPKHPDLDPKYY